MSELQAALLIIGLGVIVAVYLYGWWQQKRYRRRFGELFKASHSDALYQGFNGIHASQGHGQTLAGDLHQEPIEGVIEVIESAVEVPASSFLDDSCSLLDPRSDFIIEMRLAEPSSAASLDGLWQRKFDFRKPVQVCGLKLNDTKWERVITESQVLYQRFRIALQLVDRGGAISEAKLADFQDLVLGVAGNIKADTSVPDIRETYHNAVDLDAFCMEVDQVAGVNLMPLGNRLLQGRQIAQAAALIGMTLEADGAFHLLDAQRRSQFSLINHDSQPFQHLSLDTLSSSGLTLLLDVPRVEKPSNQFNQMIHVATELATELQVKMVDDHNVELSDNGLALIRAKIAAVEKKMLDYGIEPGNSQALRLFS